MNEIKKINIENIGSFLKFDWDNSLTKLKGQKESIIELEKNNIFYGDNGNGKTTLVKIFKKLNGNDIDLEKNWEKGNESKIQKVEVIDKNGHNFDLLSDNYKNKFLIFDKEYIKNNVGDIVFGDESTQNNKVRGDRVIILGGFVEKEKVIKKYNSIIEKLEKENTELFEKIKNGGTIINQNLLNNKKISDYKNDLDNINSKELEFYEELLKENKNKLENLEKIVKNGEILKNLESLKGIEKISFDKSKLKKTFLDVFNSIDFNFGEGNLIEEILSKTKINDLNNCLFCNQEIKINGTYIERINKLFEHFSYKEKEISNNLIELEKIIIYLKQRNKEIENLNNQNKIKFQELEKNIGNTSLNYNEFNINIDNNFEKYLEEILEKIKEKNNIKSNKINIDLDKLYDFIIKLNLEIDIFIENIKKINFKINELKNINIENTKNEKISLELELYELKNKLFIKINYETIKIFFKNLHKHEENEYNIQKIRDSKDIFRRKVSEDFKQFAEKYGKSIGKVLLELNSSLNIDFEFKNGNRNVGYERGNGKYGFEIHYNDKNRIESLSEGEKRGIALSYFFADILEKIEEKEEVMNNENDLILKLNNYKIEQNNNKTLEIGIEIGKINEQLKKISRLKNKQLFGNKILILDDPAVDFDAGHKKIISDFIAKVNKEFKQTFIFTHDSLFIKYLGNSFKNGKKEFWIYKTMGVSNIVKFDGDVFNKYLNDLEKFSYEGTKKIDDLYVLTYKLRFCIEKFIKDELLGFGNNSIDLLIKNHVGNIEKLKSITLESSNLSNIYNFCNNNGSHFTLIMEGNNALKKFIDDFLRIYKVCKNT